MILFYIKAKVSVVIFGISGASQEGVSVLVRAPNREMAKQKFEAHCRERFAKVQPERLEFDYLEIAYEI